MRNYNRNQATNSSKNKRTFSLTKPPEKKREEEEKKGYSWYRFKMILA